MGTQNNFSHTGLLEYIKGKTEFPTEFVSDVSEENVNLYNYVLGISDEIPKCSPLHSNFDNKHPI